MNSRGSAAERAAVWYYRLRGYKVLGTNVWAGGNELDVIVRRGRKLVFCEVKARTRTDHGDPLETVGWEKQRRLRRAAESWLAMHPELSRLEMSFEVVAVRDGKLERVRDAFA